MRTVITGSRYLSILLLFLSLFILPGCSVKKNHKILSFFFDGVPKPGEETTKEKEADKTTTRSQVPKKPETTTKLVKMVSRHPPYVERECKECHQVKSLTFLRNQKDALCFTCHDRDDFQGTYLHGPAAVGACLACHLPHESKYKSLLKLEGAALCFNCHHQEDLAPIEPHDRSKKNRCTQCHNPHAADNRFFLVNDE